MSAPRHRIPHYSALALVLGGAACGEESPQSLAARTRGVDTSRARTERLSRGGCERLKRCDPAQFAELFDNMDACFDASLEGVASLESVAADEACFDAALDGNDCAASLACGEDAFESCRSYAEAMDELCGTEVADVDVRSERIQAVAESYCEFAALCGDEPDVEACADDFEASLVDDFQEPQLAICLDAYLDLYACYAELSCGESRGETCADPGARLADVCDFDTVSARRSRARLPRPR